MLLLFLKCPKEGVRIAYSAPKLYMVTIKSMKTSAEPNSRESLKDGSTMPWMGSHRFLKRHYPSETEQITNHLTREKT